MNDSDLQKNLSYDEAVRVLGFEPGEVVEPHLPVFRTVEQQIGTLIETNPDHEERVRLQGELGRLGEALRTLETELPVEAVAPRAGVGVWMWVSLLVVGCVVGLGWIGNSWVLDRRLAMHEERIGALLASGDALLEKRRWPEAKAIYDEILSLRPGFGGALEGMRRIEDGRAEERRQQIGFLEGSAQAAIEGRRWEEAESATRELRAVDPENDKLAKLGERIASGRMIDKIVGLLDAVEEAIREEDWEQVSLRTRQLEAVAPNHAELPRLQGLAAEGMKLLAVQRSKARDLYTRALALDDGTFSREALEILREAMRLADRPEYQGLYDKISSYARTLHVPAEFATVGEALAAARPRDKVRIAAGVYREALVIPPEIGLEGAGAGETIVECDAAESSVVAVPPGSRGARIAGMTLQQSGIALTEERFPVVAIDGGTLAIDGCRIENGSGHGVAVVNGGSVVLRDVRVRKCGWDGLAVYGEGSTGEAQECRFDENLHHGVDAWDGGAVTVLKSRSSRNGLAGIVIMSPGVLAKVEETTCDENRELGVLVAAGGAADLDRNVVSSNLLGGILVRDPGTVVSLTGNRVVKNGTAGLVVDTRSKLTEFSDNEISGNAGQQVNLKADLGAGEAPVPEGGEIPEVIPPPEVPDDPAPAGDDASGPAAAGEEDIPAPPGPAEILESGGQ